VAYLLDTSVLIDLRDGDQQVARRVASFDDAVVMSVVSRVELEGGVYRAPADAPVRRARLDVMLAAIPVLAFEDADAHAYGAIVAAAGYSRRKLIDRMIAAQAILHRAVLVTRNPADFADIPGLALLAL
jgi:tRNA(fMet)-specific endonuclease VapC